MERYKFDEHTRLWYELHGDYYLPCLTVPENDASISKTAESFSVKNCLSNIAAKVSLSLYDAPSITSSSIDSHLKSGSCSNSADRSC